MCGNAERNARLKLAPGDRTFHYDLHTRRVPCITATPNWARGNVIRRAAMSEYPVLKDLAIIFAVSLLVILVFHRIKLPALPGFIVAGVLLGPNALGLVSDAHQVESLAEVGVILLLFTIGIEFSLSRLREMGRQVVTGGAPRWASPSRSVPGSPWRCMSTGGYRCSWAASSRSPAPPSSSRDSPIRARSMLPTDGSRPAC